ncbi:MULTISPECIES: hypothetical protein [unclassified Pseudomonas]|uniref:hypothetical protein n=1 Tax=Pseudomonas TaxID=286 RepID=UPI0014170CF0|nr:MULTISPECIES: hypothetical protein [unclassified Pseudomonas]
MDDGITFPVEIFTGRNIADSDGQIVVVVTNEVAHCVNIFRKNMAAGTFHVAAFDREGCPLKLFWRLESHASQALLQLGFSPS